MRIVFMGTRDIAEHVLGALLEAGRPDWQIVASFTQPDRPLGRSATLQPPPVKLLAQRAGVLVYQPESLRSPEVVHDLQRLSPDVGLVASYAQLLPRRVLAIPPAGWLNVHPSLLPRHRGPSPVTSAILAGDIETGVTIIKLVKAMDAGPIVDQVRTTIGPNESAGALTERLGSLGAERTVAVLDDWVAGKLVAVLQDDSAATYSTRLTREDGRLDWSRPAEELVRRVRAFHPWPGTFTTWEGRRLVVLSAAPIRQESGTAPGTVTGLFDSGSGPVILVATGQGELAVSDLQIEGRRPLSATEFVRGQPALIGSVLGGN